MIKSLSGVVACVLLVSCASDPIALPGDPVPSSASPDPAPSTAFPTTLDHSPPPRPVAPRIAVRVAVVTGIVDGDTIDVRLGGRVERIRLIGVDTPERGQRWSREATALTRDRLDGRTVWLEYDAERRDRFGRSLAYVWREAPASRARSEVRAKMHNATLLLRGLAVLLTIPPNVSYVEHFTVFQRDARARDRGLWSAEASGACDPSYPTCASRRHRRTSIAPTSSIGTSG